MKTSSSWHEPLVIATLILVGATILLAVVAALQDLIRSWVRHPDLQLTVTNTAPDSHKTQMQMVDPLAGVVASADCYYLRLLVSNEGRSRATDVQLYAGRLEKRGADGTFRLVTRFLPMNLTWAHARGNPFTSLPVGARKHCDLAHVIDPGYRDQFVGEDDPSLGVPQSRTLLSFDVEAKALTMGHLVEPGIYRLTLDLGSAETRPRRHVLEINHTGQWFPDETTMLQQGVGVTLLD